MGSFSAPLHLTLSCQRTTKNCSEPCPISGLNKSCTHSPSIISWQRPFPSYLRKSNLSILSPSNDQQELSKRRGNTDASFYRTLLSEFLISGNKQIQRNLFPKLSIYCIFKNCVIWSKKVNQKITALHQGAQKLFRALCKMPGLKVWFKWNSVLYAATKCRTTWVCLLT